MYSSVGAVTAKATAATASGLPPPSSSLARLPRRPPRRRFRRDGGEAPGRAGIADVELGTNGGETGEGRVDA